MIYSRLDRKLEIDLLSVLPVTDRDRYPGAVLVVLFPVVTPVVVSVVITLVTILIRFGDSDCGDREKAQRNRQPQNHRQELRHRCSVGWPPHPISHQSV